MEKLALNEREKRNAEVQNFVDALRDALDLDPLHCADFMHMPPLFGTWFIDPPYEFNYQYRSKTLIDYSKLGQLVAALPGQQIVCEAVCQKTGKIPTWLPFVHFGSRITSRRKSTNNHHSKELLWAFPPQPLVSQAP